MGRSNHRLAVLVSLAALVAACDGGTSSTTEGGGGNGGSTTSMTTGGGGSDGGTGGMAAGGTGGMAAGGTGGTAAGGTGGMAMGGTGGMAMGGTGGMAMGGTGGMAMGGTGGTGGSMAQGGSDQIAAVRAATDGGGLSLPVQGVYVTYTKPLLGMDVAGFFVQAEASGPAIFVAIDPASLTPAPQVGDFIDFTVTDVTTTSYGLKQVMGLGNLMVMTSGNSIDPLVTDVSMSADLVTAVDAYESRVIRLTGDLGVFANASVPQVAAPIATMGLADPNLRLRLPEAIRAQYDLEETCTVTLDYGVMWRFNMVAQPSAYSAMDLMNITCPAPTVVAAVPVAVDQVVITFDRLLDPASVDPTDFVFDNGLMATAVMVSGSSVTVTTTPMVAGTAYTVTAAGLTDVLGEPVGVPDMAMFQAYVAVAQLTFNEINPNIGGARDLIELLVMSGGSTKDITVVQRGSAVETLATFPDVNVAAGDLIVLHLTPATAAGAAPGSETTSKTEYSNGMYSANYDGAWDFHGGTTGLTYSHRVVEVHSPGGILQEAVPFVYSMVATPPAAFPGVLQALQASGGWLPADCGGQLCTYMSSPTAVEISVDYLGSGTTATGSSVQRKPGMYTKMKSDWNAAAAHSWGLPNP